MQRHKNILILTSRTGGGHVSLAEALQDLLLEDALVRGGENEQNVPLPVISIVDPQPHFFHRHYRIVSRYALWLWAAEFQFLDTPGRALLAHRVFTSLVRRQLTVLLKTMQPDLIITTYPFLTYEVMRVLEKHCSTVPLVTLFSDANEVHAAWLTERGAAATLAPTSETYKQALCASFAPERLHLVGWPVRAQFARASQASKEKRNELLAQLHLVPERFTIFLQGGGEGATHIDHTIENIQAVNDLTQKVQVILAAGTNRLLQDRYKDMRNLTVLPYTKEIAAYMAAADVIMGKAGPNILFESVRLGKPFVATSYIPGQEHANLTFIQHHGLGWIALHGQEQQALLTSLVDNSDQLHAMSATINAYRSWNVEATARIVPLIHSLCAHSS
ncbi:MAG: glycosyltransferase [Ktedonobacteraceae bacterium]